jgi:hypothetical protein
MDAVVYLSSLAKTYSRIITFQSPLLLPLKFSLIGGLRPVGHHAAGHVRPDGKMYAQHTHRRPGAVLRMSAVDAAAISI